MAEPQEDSVAIAQSGINPITGSPLSSEQRKALFRRTVAPSSILGGGGLVKTTDNTSSIVVAQTQQITSLQDQLNTIRAEIIVLNNGLSNINNTIQKNGIMEQQQLLKDQEE